MSNPIDEIRSLRAIIAKATTDAEFRTKCLKDPALAARELGVTLPEGVTFSESEGSSAIALPRLGADPDEILDDVLLADVAGGNIDPKDPQFTHPVNGGDQCKNT